MPLTKPLLRSNAVLVAVEAGQRHAIRPAPPADDVGAVQTIQEALGSLGYTRLIGSDWPANGSPSGRFGQGTARAVLAFQKQVFPGSPGEWDSSVGKKTLRKMDEKLGRGPMPPPPPSQPGDEPHPSGVVTPEQQLAATDLKLCVGVGLKLSVQDPLIVGAVTGALAQMGVDWPNGVDLVIGMVKYVNKPLDALHQFSGTGFVLGVTTRRNAGTMALGTALNASAGFLPAGLVSLLRKVNLAGVGTSGAFAAGIDVILAHNFDSIGAMHRYRATAADEVAYGTAFGPKIGKLGGLLEAISKGRDAFKTSRDLTDMLLQVSASKARFATALDVPALGVGVDVGVSVGPTTWYTFDVDAFTSAIYRSLKDTLSDIF